MRKRGHATPSPAVGRGVARAGQRRRGGPNSDVQKWPMTPELSSLEEPLPSFPPSLYLLPCPSFRLMSIPISRPGPKMKRGVPACSPPRLPFSVPPIRAVLPLMPVRLPSVVRPSVVRQERSPYLWIADTIKNGRILFLGVIDTIMDDGRTDGRQATTNVTASIGENTTWFLKLSSYSSGHR